MGWQSDRHKYTKAKATITKLDRVQFNHQSKNVASELEGVGAYVRDRAETQVVPAACTSVARF